MTKTGLKHGYFCMFLSVSLAFMTLFYCVRIFLYFNKKNINTKKISGPMMEPAPGKLKYSARATKFLSRDVYSMLSE